VIATVGIALILALPLAAAMAAVPFGRRGPGLAALVAVAVPVLVVLLAALVLRDGPAVLAVGGWQAPLGIVLRADGLACAFLAMAALVMAIVLLSARPEFGAGAVEQRAAFAFWPLALLLWGALNAIFLSGDLFNLYVGLELLTLCAVALVAIGNRAETVAAALRYLVFALLGSLLYLLGVVLLYSAYGTLDIGLLADRVEAGPTALVAAGLMTAGLAVKTALFPFHAWLPPAHSGAPAPASAMLSALVPKASFFILLRLWFDAMPGLAEEALVVLFGVLGTLAILYGSLLALGQKRLKLIIAYSTVAQIGYLFLVFPLAGGESGAQPWAAGAWSGGIFQALSHAGAKAAMFLCAGLYIQAIGHDRLEGLRGIVRAMPMTTFAFGLAAVSLVGLPPSGGFTAKYLMLTAAFASGQIALAVVLVLGGLLSALYLYRPLALAFGQAAPDGPAFRPVARRWQMLPLALALAAILLGLASAVPYDLLQVGRPGTATEGLG